MNTDLRGVEPARGAGVTRLLLLALVQGLALYALHRAVQQAVWPATRPEVLVPLYLLALAIPVSAQLLSRHLREAAVWRLLALFALVLAVLGWHFGAHIAVTPIQDRANRPPLFASAVPLVVLWMLVMAFVRARLETRTRLPDYQALFAAACRNKLTLLEAGLFTGVLWLLLVLWAALFQTLQIPFFTTVFHAPLFIYPVTALAFAVALRLVGSLDRMVDVVLAQILGLLKWLLPVAGLIVVLFTLALLPKLPGLLSSGDRALSADWLLWLVAVTVLLVNAAYQDGSREQPYGRLLGNALRCVPPLLIVIAATALYALCVRVSEHGLTVGRYWGLVTACFALLHALSYAWAAIRPGPWMGLVSRANPLLALVLALVLLLSLTPLVSPYRLSTQSQQYRALRGNDTERRRSAIQYLRFSGGRYGDDALQALARGGGDAPAELAQLAREALKADRAGDTAGQLLLSEAAWQARITVYPAGRELPAALAAAMRQSYVAGGRPRSNETYRALWVDPALSSGEHVLLLGSSGRYEVYAQQGGVWQRVPGLAPPTSTPP